MQFERVWSVTMSSVSLKVLGEIDDGDCFKWALFYANTATLICKTNGYKFFFN